MAYAVDESRQRPDSCLSEMTGHCMAHPVDENRQKPCTAILLAAGSGRRMGTSTRKQYLKIDGTPLFLYSLRAMQKCPFITDILLMMPEEDLEYAATAVREYASFEKVRGIRPGGAERFLTVAKGLEDIDWDCSYVFIHDCARPLIDQATLRRLFETVDSGISCVAAVPSKDTIKIVDADGYVVQTPDRASLWIIQTPQVFPFAMIRKAHRMLVARQEDLAARGIAITDDAMVAETMLGEKVKMVQASYRNIKATTPEDLPVIEALLRASETAGTEA